MSTEVAAVESAVLIEAAADAAVVPAEDRSTTVVRTKAEITATTTTSTAAGADEAVEVHAGAAVDEAVEVAEAPLDRR